MSNEDEILFINYLEKDFDKLENGIEDYSFYFFFKKLQIFKLTVFIFSLKSFRNSLVTI